jgi:hypothetical protein
MLVAWPFHVYSWQYIGCSKLPQHSAKGLKKKYLEPANFMEK